MKAKEWEKRLKTALGRYKYVFLVLLAGALLLLWPTGETRSQVQPPGEGAAVEEGFDTGELEERLEEVLSQVEGAGKVRVVLTLESGSRRFLAQNITRQEGQGESGYESSVVLASRGSGSEEAVELQSMAPGYRGALVVCPGGGDPQVKLTLTRAVSVLTGLGADAISVCKGA